MDECKSTTGTLSTEEFTTLSGSSSSAASTEGETTLPGGSTSGDVSTEADLTTEDETTTAQATTTSSLPSAGEVACETRLNSENDYLAPDPEDCHVFYVCQPDGDGGYIPHKLTCPNWFAFDDEANRFVLVLHMACTRRYSFY